MFAWHNQKSQKFYKGLDKVPSSIYRGDVKSDEENAIQGVSDCGGVSQSLAGDLVTTERRLSIPSTLGH